jgi:hypothetical protein
MKFREDRIAWSVVIIFAGSVLPWAVPVKVTSGVGYSSIEPHPAFLWPLIALLTLALVTLWIPKRFSLRAMLIVMTVAAIGLGWIVYATR